MGRWSSHASIAVSLALGGLFLWLAWPRNLPPPEPPQPPKEAFHKPGTAPGIAAIALPPPPPPLSPEPSTQAATAAPASPPPPAPTGQETTVEPPQPVSVTPLKPRKPPAKAEADSRPPQQIPQPPPQDRESEPASKIAVATHENSPDARTGRALLRLQEHGQGPAVEFAWPGSQQENAELYRILTRCFGMVNAIVTGQGALFSDRGHPGRNWMPNIDRYSGFIRQPAGLPVAEEQQKASEIRRLHGLGSSGDIVRIFPRNVDAAILGGLQSIIGNNYRGASSVRAEYRLLGGQLEVTNIISDGTSYSETIAVAPVRRCGDLR